MRSLRTARTHVWKVCALLACLAAGTVAADGTVGYLAGLFPAAQSKARANTPQWAEFRARLDKELPRVTTASYQGDNVMWAADYALAYRLLKDTDPPAASAY